MQLQSQIEEHQPLAESINQAQLFNQSRTFRERIGSEFESIGASELDRSSSILNFGGASKPRPTTHEMSCGGDGPVIRGLDMGTDVNNLVSRGDQGCNTVRVATNEKMIDTRVETTASATQARAMTIDAGNDGFATETKAQGSQMQINTTDAQANCNIIVCDDEEDEGVAEVTCIKCNGSQVNKKGLPCRKCGGSGVLAS